MADWLGCISKGQAVLVHGSRSFLEADDRLETRDRSSQGLARAGRDLAPPPSGQVAGLSRLDPIHAAPEVVQSLTKWDSALKKFLNSPETTTVFEAAAALERKWKEAAASSPLFDVNKLAAFEQSLKRFLPPPLTLEMQNRFANLDKAKRRYVGGGLLSTPPCQLSSTVLSRL
jgi:hypothetical protein